MHIPWFPDPTQTRSDSRPTASCPTWRALPPSTAFPYEDTPATRMAFGKFQSLEWACPSLELLQQVILPQTNNVEFISWICLSLILLRDHYVWSSHTCARRRCKAGALFCSTSKNALKFLTFFRSHSNHLGHAFRPTTTSIHWPYRFVQLSLNRFYTLYYKRVESFRIHCLFWMSYLSKEFRCLLVGETNQGRGSDERVTGSDPPNSYQ